MNTRRPNNNSVTDIDLTKLNKLSDISKKALHDFLMNYSELHIEPKLYTHQYKDQEFTFQFHDTLIKKTGTSEKERVKFYVQSTHLIGKGAFGEVNEGAGTLIVTSANEKKSLTYKKSRHCDFIYMTSLDEIKFDNLPGKSKMAYLLIKNSLFLIDKITYAPRIKIEYFFDLPPEKVTLLLNHNQFAADEKNIQVKEDMTNHELAEISRYYNMHLQKDFVIKKQVHDKHFLPDNAEHEAEFSRKTPQLKHTKGPFFSIATLPTPSQPYQNFWKTPPVQQTTITTSYIISDKKPGISLDKMILNKTPFTTDQLLQLTAAIFEALQVQVHNNGIIHRDLKPENILVDLGTMTVSIIDFGLSKNKDDLLAKEGVGNLEFGSPERCRGTTTNEKSDVYSLGKTIAQLWGLHQTHLDHLPLEFEAKKAQFKKNVTASNASYRFTFLPWSNHPIFSIVTLVENMTKLKPDERYDLPTATFELDKLIKSRNINCEHDYIMDYKTSSKLEAIIQKAKPVLTTQPLSRITFFNLPNVNQQSNSNTPNLQPWKPY